MIGAQVIASQRWSIPAAATGVEEGFRAVRRMRGVLPAWDEMVDDRLVIAVLVFEPNEPLQIDVIEAVLRQFVGAVRREPPAAAPDTALA